MRTIASLAVAALAAAAFTSSVPAAAQSAPGVDYNPPIPQPGGQQPQVIPVSDKNADQVLQPGDVMLKMLNTKAQASSWGIGVSQAAISEFLGAFSQAARSGNPATVHAAIYVGNHQTAEAHGASSEDKEGVGLRDIEHHAGYLWFVFRPKSAQLGRDAADVARRWANARMSYRVPWETPLHNSDFGPKAQAEALGYGKASATVGGPPGDKDMFCSQFVIAAYQAAVVRSELNRNPNLRSGQVSMYPGMDRQASYTSPLVMQGHLLTSQGFTQLPLIIVQKSH